MVDDEGTLIAGAIGPGEDVFVDSAVVEPEVEEGEVGALGEDVAVFEQRRDLPHVAVDEGLVRVLLITGALVFHTVLFGEGFNLAVAEHGEAWKGSHHGADAEIFIAGAELVNRRALIGIAHKVDVALEDVGIELDGVLDDGAVLGVFLVAEHVHEGAVVDAVHAESANEVALHEPEGFGEQERAGDFGGDAVDDFAPELIGHGAVEFFLGHGKFGA